MRIKFIFSFLCSIVYFTNLSAQELEPQQEDLMLSHGKLYVVIGTLLIIFLGLFFYVIKLDKQLKKLEGKK